MSGTGFSYTQQYLRELAQDVLDHAAAAGATACEVDVSEGFGQSVSVRRQEVDTIEYNRDKGVSVSAYVGQRRGYASTSDFSRQALHDTVAAAVSIARFTAEDPCAGLPDEKLLAKAAVDLDLFHPWDLTVEKAIELARRSEQAAFDVSPMVKNSEGASVSLQQSQFVSANSLGFVGGYPTTRHYLSCSAIAGAGADMQRDDWFSVRRNAVELATPEAIGDYAAQRALSRLGARKLKTRQVPVLFEAPLAIGLLGNFAHAISGGSLYRKTSFLLDSLGKQIFPDFVQIAERPHLKNALGSSYFDDDGVATHDRELVKDGVLQGYFLSTYTARKLGMETTGNAGGAHNLIVNSGPLDFAGMLKEMGRGLLVTELLGQGVNYVNGDYSRGAAGYWVERGEIAYPVHEITIAGNLKDMLRGIVAIGNDALESRPKQIGSVLIEKMTVAGN